MKKTIQFVALFSAILFFQVCLAMASQPDYKIKAGDNLWSISQKFHTSVKSILQENEKMGNVITNPNRIKIGQIIHIPSAKEKTTKIVSKIRKETIKKKEDSTYWNNYFAKFYANDTLASKQNNNFNKNLHSFQDPVIINNAKKLGIKYNTKDNILYSYEEIVVSMLGKVKYRYGANFTLATKVSKQKDTITIGQLDCSRFIYVANMLFGRKVDKTTSKIFSSTQTKKIIGEEKFEETLATVEIGTTFGWKRTKENKTHHAFTLINKYADDEGNIQGIFAHCTSVSLNKLKKITKNNNQQGSIVLVDNENIKRYMNRRGKGTIFMVPPADIANSLDESAPNLALK